MDKVGLIVSTAPISELSFRHPCLSQWTAVKLTLRNRHFFRPRTLTIEWSILVLEERSHFGGPMVIAAYALIAT
jgi:hypothetical protein